ncbi:hypothetical protein HYR99_14870 [Candidatus Poribacteria bacterium]|nr:hypothetical protein [Candidatus Poribacteria bacterium]
MMKKKLKWLWVLMVSSALLSTGIGCKDGPEPIRFDNPLDPENPNYVLPETFIVAGPGDGVTVDSADVTFQWAGNAQVTEYSFRLDDAAWSMWSPGRSVTFSPLDEGKHTFSVKGRYPSLGEAPVPATRAFTVDAVKGPALLVKPRQIRARQGADFTVQLVAEEVTNLMLAHVILTYDASVLRIGKVERGDFLATHGGTVVFFEDSSEAGRMDLNMGVGIGNPAGVDGSGAIAQLTFTALRAAQTTLKIEQNSEFRDSGNVTIPLKTRVDGDVQIE